MRPVRILLAAGLLAGLCGCVSPAEVRYADQNRCTGYGFRPGSDAFSKCLQNIDLDRSADRRAFLYGPRPGFGGGFGFRRGYW